MRTEVRSAGAGCSPAPGRVRLAELTGRRLSGSMTVRSMAGDGYPNLVSVECERCGGGVVIPRAYNRWTFRLVMGLNERHRCAVIRDAS